MVVPLVRLPFRVTYYFGGGAIWSGVRRRGRGRQLFFKRLLLLNRLMDLAQIWCVGTSRGGTLSLYKLGRCDLLNRFYGRFRKNLKMSSSPKLLNRFSLNLVYMLLGGPRCRFVQIRSL